MHVMVNVEEAQGHLGGIWCLIDKRSNVSIRPCTYLMGGTLGTAHRCMQILILQLEKPCRGI